MPQLLPQAHERVDRWRRTAETAESPTAAAAAACLREVPAAPAAFSEAHFSCDVGRGRTIHDPKKAHSRCLSLGP